MSMKYAVLALSTLCLDVAVSQFAGVPQNGYGAEYLRKYAGSATNVPQGQRYYRKYTSEFLAHVEQQKSSGYQQYLPSWVADQKARDKVREADEAARKKAREEDDASRKKAREEDNAARHKAREADKVARKKAAAADQKDAKESSSPKMAASAVPAGDQDKADATSPVALLALPKVNASKAKEEKEARRKAHEADEEARHKAREEDEAARRKARKEDEVARHKARKEDEEARHKAREDDKAARKADEARKETSSPKGSATAAPKAAKTASFKSDEEKKTEAATETLLEKKGYTKTILPLAAVALSFAGVVTALKVRSAFTRTDRCTKVYGKESNYLYLDGC